MFAEHLAHPAAGVLDSVFLHPVSTNAPRRAEEHFFGLLEAKPDLVGIAIFDRLDRELVKSGPLVKMTWKRREIENYCCSEEVLLVYARADPPSDLFQAEARNRREAAMRESIREVERALFTLGKPGPWSPDVKATDDFLDPLFRAYFTRLGLPLSFKKADYHELARLVAREAIDPEICEMLDAIVDVAREARPRE